ncbi:hypothetical protein R1521_14770 [Rhizobium brockwellii]|uniref:Uncharacterized protein n=1 Tax=Rhizobium brockwellii TaxID=3019932 RepID=A0ABU3YLI8_9HYPH|nr:hypothetical protein [Rhizobium brockwellii]MDV4179769.1 hypothetical protein [Rhizobium brockwellii]MDV4186691.1 hypothetical protein [Rhizobium brockwellii]
MTPDQKLFAMDLEDARYRTGVLNGRWGAAEANVLPDDMSWPRACFWLKAAERPDSPERYYIMIDVAGYRAASPTGSFWDPVGKIMLTASQYPKGKPGSRFAQVYRIDWTPGLSKAFYHPYDRFTLSSHTGWTGTMPHLAWTEQNTITDYLDEFQSLLTGDDYVGQ